MSFEIRTFVERDRETVVQLWHECDLVRPQNDPNRDIERKLAHGGDLFLVAVADGRIVGSVMGGYEGHRGWVNYLSVRPELHGSGIGRTLMAELERRLSALGCPKINLQIRATNEAVVEFYRRIGFVRDDVICMGRRLVDDAADASGPDAVETAALADESRAG